MVVDINHQEERGHLGTAKTQQRHLAINLSRQGIAGCVQYR
jgi:hypothetical protein